ncbi:MAG: hypothetical protein ACTSO9_06340 [Candidatus Helarchaeota archaeon]
MKELIECYKLLIDSIFSRSTGVLGDKFITKMIKKAEKLASDDGLPLLKGIEYNQNELQLVMVFKNLSENESAYTAEVISKKFNIILELINKALTMLVGKESSIKIMQDGLQDVKLNNNELVEKVNFENNLPKFLT